MIWPITMRLRASELQPVRFDSAKHAATPHGPFGAIPGPLAPWSAARDIPAPPTETFREWFARTDGGRLDESGQAAAGSRPNRAGVDVEGHYGTSARDAGLPHPTSDSEDEA